ncbi:MAG: hypothetical protein QOG48_1123, partial [Verrucomicrobiota bacterium]
MSNPTGAIAAAHAKINHMMPEW